MRREEGYEFLSFRMEESSTPSPLPCSRHLGGIAALGSAALLLVALLLQNTNYTTLLKRESPRGEPATPGDGPTSPTYDQMLIPFFGSIGDDDDTRNTGWAHLNHRVEEYRRDLVKVVEVSAQCPSALPYFCRWRFPSRNHIRIGQNIFEQHGTIVVNAPDLRANPFLQSCQRRFSTALCSCQPSTSSSEGSPTKKVE